MVFVIWYCASLRKRSWNQLFCTEKQQTSYCAPPACWGYPLPCLFSLSKRIFHSAVLLKWSEPFWFLLRSHLLTFCSLWGRKLWCSPMGVTFVSSDTFFFFFSFSLRIMPWNCSKLKVNLSIERPCSQQAGSFCFFEGALSTLCVTEQLSAQVPCSRVGCRVRLCAWSRAQHLGLGLVRDGLNSCSYAFRR